MQIIKKTSLEHSNNRLSLYLLEGLPPHSDGNFEEIFRRSDNLDQEHCCYYYCLGSNLAFRHHLQAEAEVAAGSVVDIVVVVVVDDDVKPVVDDA